MNDEEIQKLITSGYRRVSCKYGIISRIDRPDWLEFMHAKGYLKTQKNLANHYRRVYSLDNLELGWVVGKKFPSSNWDDTGFLDKLDSPPPSS